MSDPRVFFAAERTLLAWVRTGITLMALGFVVARFGLFLTLLAASGAASGHGHWPSAALGIALVLLGAGSILAALHNHRVYVVLVESRQELKLKGRTRCWKKVIFSGSDNLIGTLQRVKVTGYSHQTLLGELVSSQIQLI